MNVMYDAYRHYKEIIQFTNIAIFIGSIIGLVEVIFKLGIIFVTNIRSSFVPWIFLAIVPVGLFITYMFRHWAKSVKEGINLVFGIDREKVEKLPLYIIPYMFFSSLLSHLVGVSTGRTGVALQSDTTISHYFSRRFDDKKVGTIFLVAGIAASFSGLFCTPMAAVFFALEVLVAGRLRYRALAPCVASSFTACAISNICGLNRLHFDLGFIFEMDLILLFKLIVLGCIFGFVGGLFAWILKRVKTSFPKHIPND